MIENTFENKLLLIYLLLKPQVEILIKLLSESAKFVLEILTMICMIIIVEVVAVHKKDKRKQDRKT